MKLSYKNDKDLFYDNKIADAFFYSKFKFPIDYQSVLNTPRFPFKKSKFFISNLTYKKVNDWDNKNVISGERDNKEAGWRNFSFIDITKFFIISDLRKLGFNIDKINKILKNISTYSLGSLKKNTLHKHTFFLLEYFFLDCLKGNKNFIIIEKDEEIFFLDKMDLSLNPFYLDQMSAPITVLPFFDYVRKIAKTANIKVKYDKNSMVYDLFNILPQEMKMLDIIRNKNFETITITKKNGEISTVKAKKIYIGIFSDKDVIDAINQRDYQNVSVSVKGGKKINISREETIKL
jgi:hypothetical protein